MLNFKYDYIDWAAATSLHLHIWQFSKSRLATLMLKKKCACKYICECLHICYIFIDLILFAAKLVKIEKQVKKTTTNIYLGFLVWISFSWLCLCDNFLAPRDYACAKGFLVPILLWNCARVFIHQDDLLLQSQALSAIFMALVNRGTHTVLFKITSNAYLCIDLHFPLNPSSNIAFKLH